MGAGLVRRFVAGNTLEECLQVAGRLNSQGVQVTLNRLGEDVTKKAHADGMAQSFRQMVEEIAARKIQGNISLKPTLEPRIVRIPCAGDCTACRPAGQHSGDRYGGVRIYAGHH